jgi:hypothetical protein
MTTVKCRGPAGKESSEEELYSEELSNEVTPSLSSPSLAEEAGSEMEEEEEKEPAHASIHKPEQTTPDLLTLASPLNVRDITHRLNNESQLFLNYHSLK